MRVIRKFKVRDNQKNEFDKFYLNYKFTHRISTDDINKINEQVNKEIKINLYNKYGKIYTKNKIGNIFDERI